MLGITFKENCPDVRNTKIVDVVAALQEYGIKVTIYDPWADPEEVLHEYKMFSNRNIPNHLKFEAIILGVAHNDIFDIDFKKLKEENAVVYDVKGILEQSDRKL